MSSTLAHVYGLFYSDNFIRDAATLTVPASADQMWDNSLGGTWLMGTSSLPRQGYLHQTSTAVRGLLKVKFTSGYNNGGAVSADLITLTQSGANTAVGGLLFRYQSATSYYFAILARDGTVAVYKRVGSSDTLIGSAASGHSPLVAFTMRVSMEGGAFKVYINNSLALSCSDASPLTTGPAGFITITAAAQFRNFMWFNDLAADKGRAWADFFVTKLPDSERPPVNTVKIPGGIGNRVQAGTGIGERTYTVEGVSLSGVGPLRADVGNPSAASFRGAIEALERGGGAVALITPNIRASGFIRNVRFPSSPYRHYAPFSFEVIEYYKNQ